MQFQIKHNFTSAVLFECELSAEVATQGDRLKLGFAVRAALKAGANLTGANLTGADLAHVNLAGADLTHVNLAGADLTGADLVDGGQRSDGYRFVGWIKGGVLQIRAGCRNFTVAEYREHNEKRDDKALGAETTAILDHIERVATIRGMAS